MLLGLWVWSALLFLLLLFPADEAGAESSLVGPLKHLDGLTALFNQKRLELPEGGTGSGFKFRSHSKKGPLFNYLYTPAHPN